MSAGYSNPAIAAVIQDQQLERLNFATGLRQDPAGYSAYQQQRIGQIMSDISNRKESAFQKAQIDLGRYMDMNHNVNFYKTRSSDVANIASAMLTNNSNLAESIQHDVDISKRQFEINEWYNYNKMETLFYLQLVFMSVLAASIIMYLAKKGTISGGLAVISYSILGIMLVLVGGYKYFYTEGARDVKLWHRRYFGSTQAPQNVPAPCADVSGSDVWENAMNDAFAYADKVQQCAGNVSSNLDNDFRNAGKAATAEMVGIQTGKINALNKTGSFINSQLSGAAAVVCNARY